MTVAQHQVLETCHIQSLGHPDAGHPGPVNDDPHLFGPFPHHLEGIQERGQDNDPGGVKFVVQHRHPHCLADAVLDGEALGRGDAFQAEAPEGRRQDPHDLHNFIGVLGGQRNGHGVHVGKGLVNDALGLEFREHRQGPDVAVFIAGAAVRNEGNGIAPAGQLVGSHRMLFDLPAHRPHPRGVNPAQHRHVPDGHLALHPDQAPVTAAV